MDKKEVIIRLVRSLCLALVFGFIILTIFSPLARSAGQKPEGLALFAGILFFFTVIFTPLPEFKYNLFAILRSIFLTTLVVSLNFVWGIPVEGLHPTNMAIIIFPFLLIGLILFSWKNQPSK